MSNPFDSIQIVSAMALLFVLNWLGRAVIPKGQTQGLILVGISLIVVVAAEQLGVFGTEWAKNYRTFVGCVLIGCGMMAFFEIGRSWCSFGWKAVVGPLAIGLIGLYGAYRADAFTDACWGTGSDYQAGLQIALLGEIFHEPLPADVELRSFECSGFQDLVIDVELQLQAADGAMLMQALEKTFEQNQNHHLFKDGQKRRAVTGYPDVIVTRFELPAVRIVYGRTVTITQPRDGSEPWTIDIHAFQM